MSSSNTNPLEIYRLLNANSSEEKKCGYEAFLKRTHWFAGGQPDDLKKFACSQLNLHAQDVIASLKFLDPAFLWASQDGLESAKLKMVEAAFDYVTSIGEKFPPIIVWNFFDSQAMRLIVHDGHHRAYFFHRIGKRVNAVVLEPLGNYHEVEEKFRYAFQIRKRVTELPVSRTRGFSAITS
jgi:hypothetical protein